MSNKENLKTIFNNISVSQLKVLVRGYNLHVVIKPYSKWSKNKIVDALVKHLKVDSNSNKLVIDTDSLTAIELKKLSDLQKPKKEVKPPKPKPEPKKEEPKPKPKPEPKKKEPKPKPKPEPKKE